MSKAAKTTTVKGPKKVKQPTTKNLKKPAEGVPKKRTQACDLCRVKRRPFTRTTDPTQCHFCKEWSERTKTDLHCTFKISFNPGKRNDKHDPVGNAKRKNQPKHGAPRNLIHNSNK